MAILADLKRQPRCYLDDDNDDNDDSVWPAGPLEQGAPAEAELVRHIASTLQDFCKARGLSTYEAADLAKMTQGALCNVWAGRAWPNTSIIARIERNLGVMLWPTGHGTDLELCPRDHLDSGVWPYGGLASGAPPEAGIAREISERSHTAFSRFHSVAHAAQQLQIPEGAVEALLHGTAWIGWATLARVERNLNVRVWVPQQR